MWFVSNNVVTVIAEAGGGGGAGASPNGTGSLGHGGRGGAYRLHSLLLFRLIFYVILCIAGGMAGGSLYRAAEVRHGRGGGPDDHGIGGIGDLANGTTGQTATSVNGKSGGSGGGGSLTCYSIFPRFSCAPGGAGFSGGGNGVCISNGGGGGGGGGGGWFGGGLKIKWQHNSHRK